MKMTSKYILATLNSSDLSLEIHCSHLVRLDLPENGIFKVPKQPTVNAHHFRLYQMVYSAETSRFPTDSFRSPFYPLLDLWPIRIYVVTLWPTRICVVTIWPIRICVVTIWPIRIHFFLALSPNRIPWFLLDEYVAQHQPPSSNTGKC
jgi:hypothetical protein